MHIGALQYLQKSKLKLLWLHGIDLIEGPSKGLVVFKRKPGNQIQMLMYIFSGIDPLHHIAKPFQIHFPPDCPDCLRVGALHANLQLDQPRAHAADQFQFFFIQQVRRNLKMEVGHTIVILQNMLPDCHGMTLFRVKGPVHKLDLRHSFFQKKIQLRQNQLKIPETHRLINGGQTIATGKRAAALLS